MHNKLPASKVWTKLVNKHQRFLRKVTAAFVWPFNVKGHESNCHQWAIKSHQTNCQKCPVSSFDANLEQILPISTRDTSKGCGSLCLDFNFKGHKTNHQRCLISYLYAKSKQKWSINTRDSLERSMWPLFGLFAPEAMNACPQVPIQSHETNSPKWPKSSLNENLEHNWLTNTRYTFKGRCGLCSAFAFKGHATNYQQCLMGYLHAKFEQNRSISTMDTL